MKKLKWNTYFPIHYTLIIAPSLIAIIVLSYFYFDKPMDAFFQNSPPFLTSLCRFINNLTNPFPNLILWPLFFYFTQFIFNKISLAKKLLFIVISINASYAVTLFIKTVLGRDRPALWSSEKLYGFNFFALLDAEQSFPSGHATIISAIMMSLACLYPKRFPLFFLIGFILSFARVIVTDHYLSDILASMVIGLFIPQLIYLSLKKSGFFKEKFKLPFISNSKQF